LFTYFYVILYLCVIYILIFIFKLSNEKYYKNKTTIVYEFVYEEGDESGGFHEFVLFLKCHKNTFNFLTE